MAIIDNITAYWKLDESSGNASDSAGGGYTLTNVNTVTYSSGKINNGANFSISSSNKLTRSDKSGANPSGNISVSLWLNPSSTPGGSTQQLLFGVSNTTSGNSGNYNQFNLEYTSISGTPTLRINRVKGCTSNNYSDYTTTLTTSTWYHFVGTYDGTNVRGYLNGSLVIGPTAQSGNGIVCGADGTRIGEHPDDTGSYFNGSIDEVGVWNKELTSTEVTSLYNGGSGLTYPFSISSTIFPRKTLLGVGK